MQSESKHAFTDRIALRFADFSIRKPWLTIALSLIVMAIAASGLSGLGLATNYRVFFSPDNPELVAFEHFQETYTKNDNILFYVQPEQDAVFSPQVADAVETLTKAAWQIPYVIRVDSVSNFQHSWADGDDLTIEDLIRNGAKLPQATLDKKRDIAIAEPLIYGNILARDLLATGVNVVLRNRNNLGGRTRLRLAGCVGIGPDRGDLESIVRQFELGRKLPRIHRLARDQIISVERQLRAVHREGGSPPSAHARSKIAPQKRSGNQHDLCSRSIDGRTQSRCVRHCPV